ncbi:CDP-alcohol phosphatidyltransferase family protein [Chloroflexota bacterium]
MRKQSSKARLSGVRRTLASYLTQPTLGLLVRIHVTPGAITWIGFLVTAGASALIVTGHLFAAGFVVLGAGFFDMLDGALARYAGRVTLFGGILDSTVDRLSESVLLLGILVLYAREQSVVLILLVFVTLVGSLLVSYVRARAEALGLECQRGFFTRPERVIVLALGLLLNQVFESLVIALAIIAVLSFFTFGQRLIYVWKQIKTM